MEKLGIVITDGVGFRNFMMYQKIKSISCFSISEFKKQ